MTPPTSSESTFTTAEFTSAELGAVAHLYRGEVYRSTTWRTRLDATTNWAVVSTGVALSISFSSPQASVLPILLIGLLIVFFLLLEARRYRYFNVWRARCRLIETEFYGPLLTGQGVTLDGKWNALLANDYRRPYFHISYARAVGRRLRKNYAYILMLNAVAYFGKLIIHPGALNSMADLFDRAAVGAIPGQYVFVGVTIFHCTWIVFAIATLQIDRKSRRPDQLISIA